MATPEFVSELRALVGTRPLWLSCAIAVVLDADGSRVLLGRRADNGQWALVGGIIDPGEQPADAVVRECFEETGVVAEPEALTSVTVSGPVVYPNGDRTQYLELTFRCRAVGGEARVNDDESTEVRWFGLRDLPDLDEANRRRLALALDPQAVTAYDFSGLASVLGDGAR
ncbi:NUDIX hydrolase [Streptacidiphilus jiangxiensis]|uniref:ADP-ribose pyrophosphatase YjhB, NUDIX family n=1 Tax=Streptacidiphilus jiangxiensis TaxID=235985 RepID=A0A1H7UD98_STRJI|nr:NUDIX domain-containing protein [Streptacidiphilus jiangxiensis]SEL95042.1 ADP-ribose pyrophosphatase YjhB, NUDIX family [Streptacidiphilus jiangxiensis]